MYKWGVDRYTRILYHSAMNPLTQFKQDNEFSWATISSMTGLSKNALIVLGHMSPGGVGHVRLKTAVTLKNKIGIDLWKFYNTKDSAI